MKEKYAVVEEQDNVHFRIPQSWVDGQVPIRHQAAICQNSGRAYPAVKAVCASCKKSYMTNDKHIWICPECQKELLKGEEKEIIKCKEMMIPEGICYLHIKTRGRINPIFDWDKDKDGTHLIGIELLGNKCQCQKHFHKREREKQNVQSK
jgi:hypothetical protein